MQKYKTKWENFKLLWQIVHQFKPTIILWMLVKITLSTVVPFAQLLLMSQVIQWLSLGLSIDNYLRELLLWMAGIIVLSTLEKFIENRFDYFSETFRMQLIPNITTQQLQLDFPLITDKDGSKRYREALNLLDHRQTSLGRVFDEWIAIGTAFLSVFLYVGTLMQLEPAFIFVVIIVVLGLILLKKRNNRISDASYAGRVKNIRQSHYLSNIIGDNRIAKDVRLYQMTEWFEDIKSQLTMQFFQVNKSLKNQQRLENVFITLTLILLSAMAYLRSVNLIQTAEIDVSEFVVYVGLVTLVTSTLTNLVTQLSQFNISLKEFSTYRHFMEQKEIFNHERGVELPQEIEMIEFDQVSFTYPNNEKATIKNLSLTIHKNENLAIVGNNGAGKTTLVKLLMGLLVPDSGEILVNGYKQSDFNIQDWYRMFAPVFQDFYHFTFTIREAVIQGYEYDEKRYQKVLSDSGFDKIIEQLPKGDASHYVKEVHSDAVQLSGGQIQKLKLAQALYKDAAILVLDEPTSALDPIAESQVYEDYLKFSENKISLFISHRLASTRFCDRIIYLENGVIEEIGSHDELIAQKGKYYQLFETQASYYRNQTKEEESVVEVGGLI